jgi:capsular polysaccharide transport system ATP-binding protein
MSVDLHNVTMRISPHQALFENVNLRVDKGKRLGILGQPKSGKSTLLRLICGTETMYEGAIARNSSVSWPVSFGDFLVPTSTLAMNIRFIGRLCGTDSDDFVRKIGELAGVSELLNQEMANCPPYVRQQLTFALAVGVNFDIYLFDEYVAAGRPEFREKALQAVKDLSPEHGIVLATSAFKEITTHCDSVLVLDNGHGTYYEDVNEGVKYYKSLTQPAGQAPVEAPAQRQERFEPVQEDYTSVLGI